MQDSILASSILTHYYPIFLFMGLAFGLSLLLVMLSYLRGLRHPDLEKNSSYECGFAPFSEARLKFDVRYSLIAILFIIFDVEVAFLFPWAITLGEIGFFGYVSMMIFLMILTVGFIYEWKKGALEWD